MRCLKPGFNNYAWGKQGIEGLVGKFFHYNNPETDKKNLSQPFSEMWMGIHTILPSYIIQGDKAVKLIDYLNERNKLNYSNPIAFLFIILSENTALSIQFILLK